MYFRVEVTIGLIATFILRFLSPAFECATESLLEFNCYTVQLVVVWPSTKSLGSHATNVESDACQ